MWMSFHACDRLAQSMPFGQSANGCWRVSWVGVTADFASHRIGPSPDHERAREEHVRQCSDPRRTPGCRRSALEMMLRSLASSRLGACGRHGSSRERAGWFGSPAFESGASRVGA